MRALPALITLLKDSKPKHQYPRGGPNRHTSSARCDRKWCLGRLRPLYSGTWSKSAECSSCSSSMRSMSSAVSVCSPSHPSRLASCQYIHSVRGARRALRPTPSPVHHASQRSPALTHHPETCWKLEAGPLERIVTPDGVVRRRHRPPRSTTRGGDGGCGAKELSNDSFSAATSTSGHSGRL